MVRNILVGHDGRRVAVEQDNLDALLLQTSACLRSCIVKLGRLSDDNRAGANDEHFPDAVILRHVQSPSFSLFTRSIILTKRSNR